jgi:hypothetical protein
MDAQPATILCQDYWAAAKEIPEKEQPPNIPREIHSRVTEASQKKAVELGYNLTNLALKLVAKDAIYLAYFYPKASKDRVPVGGDLIVILNQNGKILCVHRGA